MKPNFALSLSADGIRLMQRSSPGWLLVGDVSLDEADLDAAFGQLRRDAALLEPDQQVCKLLLPNDQIRYLTIQTAPASESARREAVEAALDGATPYDLHELVYDYVIAGGETHIAAVARDTLDEAEDFAQQYGFDALRFTAIPPEGAYRGEPDFGLTRAAPRLLPAGETAEVDALPVRVLGQARLEAEATAQGASVSEAASVATPATTPDAAAQDDTSHDDASNAPSAPAAAVATPLPETTGAESAEVEAPAFTSRRTAPAEAQPAAETGKAEGTKDLFDTLDAEDSIAPKLDLAAAHREAGANEAPLAAPDTAAEAGLPVPEHSPAPDARAVKAAVKAPSADESRAASIASLRPEKAAEPSDTPRDDDAPERPRGLLARLGLGRAQRAESAPAETPMPPEPAPAAPVRTPNPALEALAASQRDRHGDNPGRAPSGEDRQTSVAPPVSAAHPGAASGAPTVSPSAPITAPAAAASASLGSATRQSPRDEADRMTVFGARAGGTAAHRPRYMGLFLTVVLLLLMAGVAAWAGIFSDSALSALFRRNEAPAAVAATEEAPAQTAALAPTATPSADLSAPAEDETEAPRARELAALPTPEEQAESEEPVATDPDLAALTGALREQPPTIRAVPRDPAPQAQLQAQDSAAATATYAATGIWPQAPDKATPPPAPTLSDLYVASIDAGVPNLDAIALPLPEGIDADQRPATPLNPPPAGTQFVLDDRGLVVATPDGALTPAGGRVYAGAPSLLPPARPAETQIAALVPGVPRTIGGVNLDAFRPRVRPDGLQERNERSELGGFTRNELAGFRPRVRPALPEPRQETEENAPGTEFAVGASLFPRARPQDFSTRVAAAQQAPATPQVSAAAAAATAAPVRTAAPSIPSSASVTRQATLKNVMRLNQINLIGVYGQPSDRRALIRLSNGRYRKVQVGDSIDGGRVAAIGDSELRYVKRGRDVILRMPTEG
ncbi:hypothetical protein [Maritimibacter alkaliphilus]|uniref:hypothetical protein n=1 Tax=Maritimibacter alkaliphilus TaxID=404236 RepID=UPI001C968ACD|nr:hypothetical protein [Maritimibacter alkaliphilus]MBY6092783.1 hypothetical protein [Maritimibacter alkaliphilus]